MITSSGSRAVTIVAALCCGWLPLSPANSENLATNGSFEIREGGDPNNHIDALTPDREDLVGWQVTGKSIDWIGPTRWRASHGEHCLDIDAPGGIKQTLDTTPGLDYRLQFDLAGNVETEPLNKVLRVSINGVDYDFSFDAAGHTREQLGWVRKEIIFNARGGHTTLCFVNAAERPTASGVALDNVVVSVMKPGRYTTRTTDQGTILVDNITGQAWMLMPYKETQAWLPIEGSGHVERLRQLGGKVTVKDGVTLVDGKAKWIPLAPLVQADRDTQDASWSWDGQTAAFGSGKPVARVSIPLTIRGSYELRTRVTIVQAKESTAICLPITEARQAVLHIRGDSGNTASETATILLAGLNPAPQPKSSASIDIGTEYSLTCTVVESGSKVAIDIRLGDQVLFQWAGLVSQIAEGKSMRRRTVQLQTAYYTSSRFTDLRLKMLSGKATPLFPSETDCPSPLVPRDPPEGE